MMGVILMYLVDYHVHTKHCGHAGGLRVTLGSDAHRPQDVGAGFDRAVQMLEEAGYWEIVTFERRKPKARAWREA